MKAFEVLSAAFNSAQLNKSRSAWEETQENTPVYVNILFIAKSLHILRKPGF